MPLSPTLSAGVVYDDEVAPGMSTPFRFHWYVSVAAPAADTASVAVWPSTMLRLCGPLTITGGATGRRG